MNRNKGNWEMRKMFDAMMDNLMMDSVNKPSELVDKTPIIKMVYEITDLGFQGVQVRSFFKPRYKRSSKKC